MTRPEGGRPRSSGIAVFWDSAKLTLDACRKARLGKLIPFVAFLLLLALLLAVASASGPLAPFVYPLL